MVYDIKTTEAVKGFATVVQLNDAKNKTNVTFEIIKCKEKLTEEESDYLGIIRSEIYYLAHNIFDKIIVMTSWSDHDIYGSYQLVMECQATNNIKDIPVFFVIGCNYPCANQHLGTLSMYGFYQADHLTGFENNYVLVRTATLKDFDAMNKLHYAKVLEFESRRAKEIESVAELKKEQFKHLSTSDKYKSIRKAIDNKKAEIVGISDKELEEARNIM